MRKYAFVMLCNEISFFEVFVKYLPKEKYDDFDMYIVYDNRLRDISSELQTIALLSDNRYINECTIVNGDKIINHYSKEMPYAILDKMVLNNLKDVYYLETYDKIFSVDDDIVMLRDINHLMEFDLVGQYWHWDRFLPNNQLVIYEKIFDDFNKTSEIYHLYNTKKVSAGQYVMHKKYLKAYLQILKDVYSNEIIKEIFENQNEKQKRFRWILSDVLTNILFLRHIDDIHFDNFCEFMMATKPEKVTKLSKKVTTKAMYHYYEKYKHHTLKLLDEKLEKYHEN